MQIRIGKYTITKFDAHNLIVEVDKYNQKDKDKSVARAKRSWRNKKKNQLIGYARNLEEALYKIYDKELSDSDAKSLKELKKILPKIKAELIQEINCICSECEKCGD